MVPVCFPAACLLSSFPACLLSCCLPACLVPACLLPLSCLAPPAASHSCPAPSAARRPPVRVWECENCGAADGAARRRCDCGALAAGTTLPPLPRHGASGALVCILPLPRRRRRCHERWVTASLGARTVRAAPLRRRRGVRRRNTILSTTTTAAAPAACTDSALRRRKTAAKTAHVLGVSDFKRVRCAKAPRRGGGTQTRAARAPAPRALVGGAAVIHARAPAAAAVVCVCRCVCERALLFLSLPLSLIHPLTQQQQHTHTTWCVRRGRAAARCPHAAPS